MIKHGDLTPDLCDEHADKLSVLEPGFASFGGYDCFHGQAVTVYAFEDNSKVKELVGTPGENRILVVDGGASMRRAMLGDQVAAKAMENGWQAVIINGCIRDCAQIAEMDIAVYALGTHPMKTDKFDVGQINVPLSFAGVTIHPGDYVAGDLNGIVVARTPLV